MALQLDTIKRGFSMAGLFLRKYAPEILVGTGLAAGVGATVLAIVGTVKAPKVIESTKERLADIDTARSRIVTDEEDAEMGGEEPTERKIAIAIRKTYADAIFELLKLYGPTVLLTGASIGCILSAFKILKVREAALMSALAAIQTAYSRYREQVAAEYGHEKDLDILDRCKELAVDEMRRVAQGVEDGVIEIDPDAPPNPVFSPYARWFEKYDASNGTGATEWTADKSYNHLFLTGAERNMNTILKYRGYLFLNDVYGALGMDLTPEGQLVGWLYQKDPKVKNDGYVTFGLDSRILRDDYHGRQATDYYLDFNPDGVIFDLIGPTAFKQMFSRKKADIPAIED